MGALRYVVGGLGAACLTAYKWDFVPEDWQNALQIAAIPVVYLYGGLEGATRYADSKATGYRKEAKGFIDRANKRAGRPIEEDPTEADPAEV